MIFVYTQTIVFISIKLFTIGRVKHLNRNANNVGKIKKLTKINGTDNKYRDENGLIWEEQPLWKNRFHMPSEEFKNAKKGGAPWSRKFLAVAPGGGEYELIIKNDGCRITTGIYRETFNYSRTDKMLGINHVVTDVAPSLLSNDYITKHGYCTLQTIIEE